MAETSAFGIEVHGVSRDFGKVRALDKVSLTIDKGSMPGGTTAGVVPTAW